MASWDEARVDLYTHWKAWWLERHPEEIGEYSWSYLFERGKQIRPRLFCELWRYLCPDRPPCAEFAFVLECMHVISLLLDDLPWMDDAAERRGYPTLHRRFSLRKALLLAYDVAELAWEVSQTTPLLRESQEQTNWEEWIRTKAKQLWIGQWLDLSRSGLRYEWAAWKTGTLFEAVAEGVAIGVGLDSLYWKGWGRALGVLFQWVDDWEDLEEDGRMGQRNAFNEAREETLASYHELWTAVVQGIGSSWWERPFGRYLWQYFSRVGHRTDPIPSLTSSTTLPIWQEPLMDLHTRFIPGSSSGLQFLILFQPYLYRPFPRGIEGGSQMVRLWDYPEEEWIHQLEQIQGFQPFLPVLRLINHMITAVTFTSTTELDE